MKMRLSKVIRLAASPTFLFMAWATHAANDGMDALVAVTCRNAFRDALGAIGLHLPDGVVACFGSMWVMYALMGVFHSGAWLELVDRERTPSESVRGAVGTGRSSSNPFSVT